MANAVRYIANVGKSVKYATVDVLKELNPVITDTIETNQDVVKVTYSSIKNFKSLSAKAMKTLSQSQVGELAKDYKKNLFEDIKNGTFYNKKRQEQVDAAIGNSDAWGADMSEFFVDDMGTSDDVSEDDFFSEALDDTAERATTAVSQVLARTSEYQVEATRQSTNRILAQTSAMSAQLHSDLGVLNANVSGLMKFNTEAMATHIENSKTFYERQQQQMDEQTSILKEMLEFQKSIYTPKSKSTSSKIDISDVFTSSGTINIAEYLKLIRQNAGNLDGTGIGSWIKEALDSGMGKSFAANPLGMVVTGAVKGFLPKVLKDSFKELNDTIAGSMATAVMNAYKAKDSDNPIISAIGNIFGVDLSNDKKINTSKYNKDATFWNGKDHKALTEVIPTLLNKIYSAISGTNETRYDYEEGKFVSLKSLNKQFEKSKNRYVSSANDTVMPYLENMINQMKFSSTERQKEFVSHLETILKENFKKGQYFNPNDKSIDAKTYGLKGDHAEYDVQLIRRLMARIPKSKQLLNNTDFFSARSQFQNWLSSIEDNGDSVYTSLFNGSISDKKKSKSIQSPVFSVSKKLDETNSLLADIKNILLGSKDLPKQPSKKSANKKANNSTVKNTTTAEKEKTKKSSYISDLGMYIDTRSDAKFNVDQDDIDSFEYIDPDSVDSNTYIKRLKEANTATKKLTAFLSGTSELAKQPLKFVANVLKKTDERVYTLLFGSDKDDKNSILGKISYGLDIWFDDLRDIARNKFEDFKDWLTEKSLGEKAHGILSKLLGINTEEWFKDFRKAAFGSENISMGEGVRKIFSEGFREMWTGFKNFFKEDETVKDIKSSVTGVKNAEGKKVDDINTGFDNLAKALNLGKQNRGTDNGEGKITGAAKGLRKVSKTGVIAVSEGEMIVPPDMNPYNIKKREKSEKEAINKFEKAYGDIGTIPAYATGGSVDIDPDKKEKLDRQVAKIDRIISRGNYDPKKLIRDIAKYPAEDQEYIMSHINDDSYAILHKNYKAAREIYKAKSLGRDAYEKGKEHIGYKMADAAKDIFSDARENKIVDNIVSKISSSFNKNEKTASEGKEVVNDIMSNFSKYLPRVAAGGVTGLALSTLLGLAGGPLLGAAVGSGLGLLSNSKKLQKWLFGEKVVDSEGNESVKGGVLGDDIKKNVHKYFPNMTKGAILGGITSILPFVPGGPMAGILVGSAIGFAKSNDKLNKQLFGEDKILGKMKKTLEQKLPRMGLGAATMFLGGPFGITTNLIVGAGLGFVSDTDKFKDIVFGTKGSNGERTGGLVGFIKAATEIPIQKMKDIWEDTRKWFSNKFLAPLRKAADPFARQLKNMGNWFKDALTGGIREHITKPIGAKILKVLRPIENITGSILRTLLFPVRGLLSIPSKAVGAVGGALRRRQLRRVGAASGSSSQRLAEMEELDAKRPGVFKRFTNTESYKSAKFLSEMSDDQLLDLNDQLEYIKADKFARKGDKKKALDNAGKRAVNRSDKMFFNDLKQKTDLDSRYRVFSVDMNKTITDLIIDGNDDQVYQVIMQQPSNPARGFSDKQKKEFAERARKAAQAAAKGRKNAQEAAAKARELKEKYGIDITKAGFKRDVEQDIKLKGLDKEPEQIEQEKSTEKKIQDTATEFVDITKLQHDQLMQSLDRIGDILEDIAYPESKKAKEAKKKAEGTTTVQDAEKAAEEKLLPMTLTPTDAETIAEEGSASDVNDIISGKATGGRIKGLLRRLTNNIFRKKKQSKTVITENGPIKTRLDAQGNEIPDERDAETKETLEKADEQRETQKGILSKISGLGDKFKELLGFDNDEEEEKEGIFSKIIKGALKYALPVLGGLAGLGLVKRATEAKVKVQQRDANGNKMYDQYGNPIMTEMTIADAVKNGAARMWLGDDLTGNTNGAWYHIKDFTTNTVLPLIGDGLELLTQKIPDIISSVVQYTIEKAPHILAAIGKGIAVGIWNTIKEPLSKIPGIGKLFGSSDKKEDKSTVDTSGTSQLKVNVTGQKSTTGASTSSTVSTGSTTSAVESAYNKKIFGITSTSSNSQTPSTTTTTPSGVNKSVLPTLVGADTVSTDNTNSVKESLAYKNASTTVQKKVLSPLSAIWNNQILDDGTTVAQLCNDPDTVIAEFTDSYGNTYQVTGATILWYPETAAQVFGIDISLTNKEKEENSASVRNATGYDPGSWALTKIITTGGKYGNATAVPKILATGGKLISKAGKGIKSLTSHVRKVPVLKGFHTVGKATDIAAKATQFSANVASIPVRATDYVKQGVQEFSSLRKGGFTAKESAQWMAGNAQVSARKGISGAKDAFNATMDARQASRSAEMAKKSKGIFGGAKDAIRKGKNSIMDKIDNTVRNAGNKVMDTASNATRIDSSDVSKAKKGMSEALSKISQKSEKAASVINGAGKLSSAAQGVVSKLTKILGEFFSNNTVVNALKKVLKSGKAKKEVSEAIIKEALEKFADKILERFTKGIAKTGAKVVAKISTKLAAYIGSGGLIAVAFAVVDFVRGMSKADVIMKVEKPTIAERFISGLVNAFAEAFFITLIIDTETLVQMCIDLLEYLGFNFEDLRKRQEEAEANCAQYNREHDPDITVEEYLTNDNISTKVKNALSKVGSTIAGAGKSVVNIGKGAVNKVKEAGESILNGVSSLFGVNKSKEEATNESYIYDEQGNVIGLDTNSDGNPETMYIRQGDGDETEQNPIAGINTDFNNAGVTVSNNTSLNNVDQTQTAISGSGGVISEQNQKLINQSYSDINNSIPNMIKQTKANLAKYFGVNPSDMNRTTAVGINTMKGSGPEQLFQRLKSMWSQANTKIGPFVNNLPKTLYSGMKDLSRFLAISMGFADPQDEDVDLNELVKNESYVDRRAEQVLESSPFAWLGGVNGTASIDKDIQEQSRDAMIQGKKSNSETFTSKIATGAKGFMKAIGNFFGIGGSGSGLDDQAHVIEGNRADNESNFISQINGAYARKTFKGPNDTERQTVADAGCAPAVATMAINSAGYSAIPITMDEAMNRAANFKLPNGGVTADYFIDEFKNHGLNSAFVTQTDPEKDKKIVNQLSNGNPVILLGRDASNKSKSSSPFGPNDHYVVATGLSEDKKSVYINDPEASKPKIKYGISKVLKHSILGIVPLVRRKNQKDPNTAIAKLKRILKNFSGRAYVGDMAGDYLGRISRPFESGTKGPTAVEKDKWANDGGCSCGTYQMTWKSGSAKRFWTWSGYADKYGNASDPSTLMSLWKKAAEEDPDAFFAKEHEFIYENYYVIAVNDCKKKSNFNPDTHSRAMQECIWSWAIHRGPQSAANDFSKCIKNAGIGDPQKADENTLVKACYDYRYNICQSKGWLPPGDKRYKTSEQSSNSEYYMVTTELGGKPPIDPKSGSSNGVGTGQTGGDTQTSSEGTIIDKLLSAFNDLGAAYGLTTTSSSGTTDSGEGGTSDSGSTYTDMGDVKGNVSSNKEYAKKQVELVRQMKSVEGKLQYSQGPGSKYPGPSRDPDTGYADCSSTVQWAYKNVLGVDPGGYTGAQQNDSDTYQVATSTADESKLQLGDLLLKNGHVEMYSGNHTMIGHGGGKDGKTPGPTTKDLGGTPPYDNIRRWVGFRDSTGTSTYDGSVAGSGSGMFVSQNDSRYANKSIGKHTVAEVGCAPAVATMAVSSVLGGKGYNMNTAIKNASRYQNSSGDVTADYFADEFARNGVKSSYISGGNTGALKSAISKGSTVLLGRDSSNTSKSKSPFGSNGHYVLATGMSKDGKSVYVNDPEAKTGNKKYSSDILKHTVLGVNASGGASNIPAADSSGTTTDITTTNDQTTTNTTGQTGAFSQLLDAFNNLAIGYGLKADNTSESSSGDSGSSAESGSYSGSTGQEQVWSYLKNKGIPDEGIAGLMGNINHESGFKFNNVENLLEKRLKDAGKSYHTDDLYTKAVDNNTINRAEFLNPLPGKQYGYGLVQWTSPGRKAGLYDLVKSRNVSIADPGAQMDWLWQELNESYSGVLDTMKNSKDIRTVSTKVLKDFESPADTGSNMQQMRYESAKSIYDTYHGKDIGGSGSGLSDTPIYNYASKNTTTTKPTEVTTQKVDSKSSKVDNLIEIVVKLLAKVVDNTTSIKDIASLLVKLVEASGSNKDNSSLAETATNGSMVASQLALQALKESTRTTEDEEIAKLIRSVEAIAKQ